VLACLLQKLEALFTARNVKWWNHCYWKLVRQVLKKQYNSSGEPHLRFLPE
jgi:hypothetical protein